MDTAQAVTSLVAFCITLFLYVHITYHLRRSDDLDVYHIDYPSREKLDEICGLRQPVVFKAPRLEDIAAQFDVHAMMRTYGEFDVHVRKCVPTSSSSTSSPSSSSSTSTCGTSRTEKHMPVKLSHASVLLRDAHGYFSENNAAFLEDTGLDKHMRKADYLLRPSLVLTSSYDVLMGGTGSTTPLRYHIHYKTYMCVARGAATLKLASPKNARHLTLHKDYDAFEFYAESDPWSTSERNGADRRVKYLEIALRPTQVVYVPPYWLYSIRFDAPSTSLLSLSYQTYMSYVSTAPYHVKRQLQKHNVCYKLPLNQGTRGPPQTPTPTPTPTPTHTPTQQTQPTQQEKSVAPPPSSYSSSSLSLVPAISPLGGESAESSYVASSSSSPSSSSSHTSVALPQPQTEQPQTQKPQPQEPPTVASNDQAAETQYLPKTV